MGVQLERHVATCSSSWRNLGSISPTLHSHGIGLASVRLWHALRTILSQEPTAGLLVTWLAKVNPCGNLVGFYSDSGGEALCLNAPLIWGIPQSPMEAIRRICMLWIFPLSLSLGTLSREREKRRGVGLGVASARGRVLGPMSIMHALRGRLGDC